MGFSGKSSLLEQRVEGSVGGYEDIWEECSRKRKQEVQRPQGRSLVSMFESQQGGMCGWDGGSNER